MNHLHLLTKKIKREGQEEYSDWCHLPQLFLSSLLYFLSPKSRWALKATCKAWNEAKLLPVPPVGSPSSPYHSAPLLMSKDAVSMTHEFRHPMSDDDSFEVSFDHAYLNHAQVYYSNFGWLLMEGSCVPNWPLGKSCLFFFNPFTKETMQLPPLATSPGIDNVCFTSPPTSLDCQVFGLIRLCNIIIHLKLSENVWRMDYLSVDQELSAHVFKFYNIFSTHDDIDIPSLHSPVFYRDSLYYLSSHGRIYVYSFSKCAFNLHNTDLSTHFIREPQSFLLEVDGKLLGIFRTQEIIVVMWLDVENWEWHMIQPNDLQDKILYLGTRSFVQCDATTIGKGNKIYDYDHGRSLPVYYSLDTNKYHFMDSTRSYDQEKISYHTWTDTTTWICPTVTDT